MAVPLSCIVPYPSAYEDARKARLLYTMKLIGSPNARPSLWLEIWPIVTCDGLDSDLRIWITREGMRRIVCKGQLVCETWGRIAAHCGP